MQRRVYIAPMDGSVQFESAVDLTWKAACRFFLGPDPIDFTGKELSLTMRHSLDPVSQLANAQPTVTLGTHAGTCTFLLHPNSGNEAGNYGLRLTMTDSGDGSVEELLTGTLYLREAAA